MQKIRPNSISCFVAFATKNSKAIILLIAFSTIAFNVKALNATLTHTDSIGACKENTYTLTYTYATAHTVIIDADLLPAITSCGSAGSKPPVLIHFLSVNGTYSESFDTTNTKWYCTINPSSSNITLQFKVWIDCSVIDQSNTNQSYDLKLTFSEQAYLFHFSFSGSNPDSVVVNNNIFVPNITVTYPSQINASYLDTSVVTFYYVNHGSIPAHIWFIHDTIEQGYCKELKFFKFQHGLSANGTFFNFNPGVEDSVTIPANDTLIVKQYTIMDTCISNSCLYRADFTYRCNISGLNPGILCTACKKIITSTFSFINKDNPLINVIPLGATANNYYDDFSCFNDTNPMKHWDFAIVHDTASKGALDSLVLIMMRYGGAYGKNFLTLISQPSVVIKRNCLTCTIDTLTVSQFGFSLCQNLVPNPLLNAFARVHDFRKGDTLFISFNSMRCSETDDASLLNVAKSMNQWTFNITKRTVCNNITNQMYPLNRELYIGHANFHQQLEFYPSVSVLLGDTFPNYGDSANFIIDTKGLMRKDIPDYQIFGCNQSQVTSGLCNPQGLIRTKINIEQGMKVMNPGSQVYFLRFKNGVTDTILPVYYYTALDTNHCDSGAYYFYFNIDSILLQTLEAGHFFFRAQACCPLNGLGKRHIDVRFYMLPNPDSCFTVTYPANHTDPPIASDTTKFKFIPLSSVNHEINLTCRGCKTPGAIATKYRMDRTSFGLQDSNDDGFADNGLTKIDTSSAWFQNYESQLTKNFSSFSDSLSDFMTILFQDGDNQGPNPGYTYQEMINNNSLFRYLQIDRSIPNGLDTLKITPTKIIFYIDTLDSTHPNCYECPQFNVGGNYRTMHKFVISGANLALFLESDVSLNRYLYSFSCLDTANEFLDTTALSVYNDTIYAFHSFNINQRYRIKVDYDECGYFRASGSDLNSATKKLEISNLAFFSGSKKGFTNQLQEPQSLAELHSLGWTIVQPPNLTIINQLFADSFTFWCEGTGAFHYAFSSDFGIRGERNLYSACGLLNTFRAISTRALALKDIYPYEYRPPVLFFNEYRYKIPAHFNFGSVTLQSFIGVKPSIGYAGYPPLTISTPTIDADTFTTILETSLPPLQCISQSDSVNVANNTAWAGDLTTGRLFTYYLNVDTCVVGIPSPPPTDYQVILDTLKLPCQSSGTCSLNNDTSFNDTPNYNYNLLVNSNIQTTHTPSIQAYTKTICFNITLANPVYDSLPPWSNYNISSSAGANAFIAIPNLPFFTNWTFNGTPAVNGIIQVANSILPNGSVSGTLCVTFSDCLDDTTKIEIITGFSCNGYPANYAAALNCCDLDRDSILIIPSNPILTTTGKQPTNINYTLCDTVSKFIEFYTPEHGDVYPEIISLSNLPPHLTLVSIQLQDCNGTYSANTLTDSLPGIYPITSTQLAQIGFNTGVMNDSANKDCLKAIINLLPECGFENYSEHIVTLSGESYCGDKLSATDSANISFTQIGSQCNDCFTISKTVDKNPVNALDTVTYSIIVCANNGSSQTVYLEDILPQGFVPIVNLATNLPTIPAQSCDTFLIQGYFLAPDDCPNTTDTARLITFAYAIDTLEATVCNTVNVACYTDGWFVPNTGDTLFSMVAGMPTNNAVIYLPENFYFDASVTFTNCTIYVAMGKQVFIYQSYSLILDNSIIEGCGFMWQGIIVDTLASMKMINNSWVRDGNVGIQPLVSAHLLVYDSYITDCVTGVYIDSTYDCSKHNIKLIVEGTKFGLIRPAFYQDYPLQPVHGDFPKVGIEIYDMPKTNIGSDAAHRNFFNKLNSGFVQHRSVTLLFNNRFEEIKIDSAYTEGYRGSAIVSRGTFGINTCGINSDITIKPNWNDTTVFDCHRGVYTDYSNLNIDSNLIYRVYTGIFSKRTTDNLRAIVNNSIIRATFRGINWRENVGASQMLAYNNTITISGDSLGIGINMVEINPGTSNYQIEHNMVSLTNARNGIAANSVFKPKIISNIVNQFHSGSIYTTTRGIVINSCDSAVVACDSIYTNYPSTNDLSRGINSVNSSNSIVDCNTTLNQYYGTFFGGTGCAGTAFKANRMNGNYVGLYLNGSALIGEQPVGGTPPYHGNVWDTATFSSGYGAVNRNAGSLPILIQNLFTTNQASAFHNPIIPDGTQALWGGVDDKGWFDPQNSGNTFSCGTSCEDSAYSVESPELRMSIIRDSSITSDYIPESKAMAKQDVYADAMQNDSLLTDTVIQNFVNANAQSAIGKLYETKENLGKAFEIDSATNAALTNLDELISALNDSISIIDSLTVADTLTNYSTQRAAVINDLNALQQSKSGYLEQNLFERDSSLTEAEISNSSAITSETPHDNEQFLNEISIIYERNGIAGVTPYYWDIFSIASQCPYSGGDAVILARNFIELFDERMAFDDEAMCASQGIYKFGSDSVSSFNNVQIVPNPAKDFVNVILSNKSSGVCKIDISDALGKQVYNSEFDCNTTLITINTSSFTVGSYQIRIRVNESYFKTSKLIIIR